MSTTIPSSSRASGVKSSSIVPPQFGYDRTRLIEFIATASPSSTLNTNIDPSNATTTEPIAGTVSGGSVKKASVNLYASALSQLATELAKVPNVAWEKVGYHIHQYMESNFALFHTYSSSPFHSLLSTALPALPICSFSIPGCSPLCTLSLSPTNLNLNLGIHLRTEWTQSMLAGNE